MKSLSYLIVFFLFLGCSTNRHSYWCGDHPCINKKEKEAYFKKTMIVEVRKFDKKKLKNDSDIEKIIQQAEVNEKKRIKDEKELAKIARLEEKRRIKDEKELEKMARLEEKRRIKEEKKLAKMKKLERKRQLKEEKNLAKQIKKEEKSIIIKKKISSKKNEKIKTNVKNTSIETSSFKKIVERITQKNNLRSYPEINDMPN